MAPLTVMNPICIVCGELASQSVSTCSLFTIDGLEGVFAACTVHSVDEVREGLRGCRAAALPYADPDYWPMELAHPYSADDERARAAEARANRQTATLVEGKTRARRVVHHAVPRHLMPSDDPTAILDQEPEDEGQEVGDGVRLLRSGVIRVARLDADNNPTGTFLPIQGATITLRLDPGEYQLACHHIDGDPLNNDPSNLAIISTGPIARGGMTEEDYARFGLNVDPERMANLIGEPAEPRLDLRA